MTEVLPPDRPDAEWAAFLARTRRPYAEHSGAGRRASLMLTADRSGSPLLAALGASQLGARPVFLSSEPGSRFLPWRPLSEYPASAPPVWERVRASVRHPHGGGSGTGSAQLRALPERYAVSPATGALLSGGAG